MAIKRCPSEASLVVDARRASLEQDVAALAAELTDPEEARALVALLALATVVDWQPGQDNGYRPFVYPH